MQTCIPANSSRGGDGYETVMWSRGITLLVLFLKFWLSAPVCHAQDVGTCEHGEAEAFLDVNNVRAAIYNNGNLFWRGSGTVYTVPKRSGVNALFSTMVWIGGLVDGELRFAGTVYGPWEFWPGPLDEMGNPPFDCTEYDRIYSIYRDSLRYYEETGIPTRDLIDWPADLGAPVIDGDGIPDNYNLVGGDRPALVGDQMLWWVMNDAGNKKEWSKRPPFPLEVHVTVFAYNDYEPYPYLNETLRQTTFYQFKLIYKGDKSIEDAWFGLHVDSDLGYDMDDYIGSDSTLGLGFFYNADDNDEDVESWAQYRVWPGYGTKPPAIGIDFLQGPIVLPDAQDNDGDDKSDEPGERQGMTSFLQYFSCKCPVGNPDGPTNDPYTYLQGLWLDGKPMTIGGIGYGGNIPTHFIFSGNPPDYWSEDNQDGDGARNTPGQRRIVISTGPFRMEPGDEQEIVLGIIWSRGEDRLDSVYKLKREDAVIQSAIDILLEPRLPVVEKAEEIPKRYTLVHNYPNPFAGTTTFSYDLPADDRVKLRVYDVLGRVVETLVNTSQPAGPYEIEFDGSHLTAGVYFYRFTTTRVSGAHRMVLMQ